MLYSIGGGRRAERTEYPIHHILMRASINIPLCLVNWKMNHREHMETVSGKCPFLAIHIFLALHLHFCVPVLPLRKNTSLCWIMFKQVLLHYTSNSRLLGGYEIVALLALWNRPNGRRQGCNGELIWHWQFRYAWTLASGCICGSQNNTELSWK